MQGAYKGGLSCQNAAFVREVMTTRHLGQGRIPFWFVQQDNDNRAVAGRVLAEKVHAWLPEWLLVYGMTWPSSATKAI